MKIYARMVVVIESFNDFVSRSTPRMNLHREDFSFFIF